MNPNSDNNGSEPPLAGLVIAGILMIVGAFVSATIIIIVHTPIGH